MSEATPVLVETADSAVEAEPEAHHRLRRVLGAAALGAKGLGMGLLGAAAGLTIATHTAAHVEVAGTHSSVETTTTAQDELDVNQTALTLTQAANRNLLGQPVGVKLNLNVDTTKFIDSSGNFDATLVPAYFSLFSDTKQLASDVEWAIIKHDLWGAGIGFAAGTGLYGAYRSRRSRHPDIEGRPFRQRVAIGLVAASMLYSIPSESAHLSAPPKIQVDPLLANTPLANSEVGGFLSPGISYIEKYIEKYITNTNKYYDELLQKLVDKLKTDPIGIPSGDDIVNFGYVSDRHCNIGMDRVIIGLMNAYNIKLLVSGGDDDFSGSFSFESACTNNLAERSKKADITDVATLGNHDDQMTADDEKKQGIKVLDDQVISVDGVNFLGDPDPRTSRYGQGIEPAAESAQQQLMTAQGKKIGEIACKSDKKIIVVLHGPPAGNTALQNGCGNATVALDGHTHVTAGPTDVPLPDGSMGNLFVSGSSGGAPAGKEAEDASLLERVTVGPLQHNASVNVASYNKRRDELVGVTVFTFMPDQTITSIYLPATGGLGFDANTGKITLQAPNPSKIQAAALSK